MDKVRPLELYKDIQYKLTREDKRMVSVDVVLMFVASPRLQGAKV